MGPCGNFQCWRYHFKNVRKSIMCFCYNLILVLNFFSYLEYYMVMHIKLSACAQIERKCLWIVTSNADQAILISWLCKMERSHVLKLHHPWMLCFRCYPGLLKHGQEQECLKNGIERYLRTKSLVVLQKLAVS